MGTNGGYNGLHPKLTKEQIDHAVARYRGGDLARDIAADLDVTVSAVYYHLRCRGLTSRGSATYQCTGCGETKWFRPTHSKQAPPTTCRHCGPTPYAPKSRGALPVDLVERGLCTREGNVDTFYPHLGGSAAEAKEICARCTVIDVCLRHALDTAEPHGVWGGRTVQERRKILKQRKAAA